MIYFSVKALNWTKINESEQRLTQMLEVKARNVEKNSKPTAFIMFAHTYKIVLHSLLEHISITVSA